MRSTFKVLFYTKNQAIKNGRVPVMGRITVNGTTASFSCKRDVSLSLWDAKGNCARGKSEEARRLNRELDNIKAQSATSITSIFVIMILSSRPGKSMTVIPVLGKKSIH